MATRSCIWLASEAELAGVFSDDLILDGNKGFVVGDMVLVAESTGVIFYTLKEFAASPVNNPGIAISGQWSFENNGYPVFYKTVFSYSLQSMRIDFSSGPRTIGCTLNAEATDLCNMFHNFIPETNLLADICSNPAITPVVSPQSKSINVTTETDYLEDAAADLVWQPDKVEVNGTPGAGSALTEITSHVVDASTKLFGVRMDEEYYVEAERSTGTSTIQINHMAQDGTWTVKATANWMFTAAHSTIYPPMAMSPVTADLVAVGDEFQTGSKPEQGIIGLWDIDASFQLTNPRTVSPPVPARYGHFGKAIGICNVDDGTYGADRHLITGNLDEVVIMRESNSFATGHQVIALERNDFVSQIWCGKNSMAFMYYDDSTNNYNLSYYKFNGSIWEISGTSYSNESSYHKFVGAFIDDAIFIYYRWYDARTYIYEVNTGSVTERGQILYGSYGFITGDYSHVCAMFGDSRIATYYPSTKTAYIWEVPASGGAVELISASSLCPDSNSYMGPYAAQGPDGKERAYIITWNGASTMTLRYFEGVPGTLPAVNAGKHLFSSNNDDARLLIHESATSILSASLTFSQPTLGKIRFAISYDDGTTWQVYESGVGYHALTALTDLKTTAYGDSSLFDIAMQALDVANNKKISLAFCIDRDDPSIDDEVNSTISSLTYSPNAPATNEYTLQKISNLDNPFINVNVNTSNDISVGERFARIAFFDDMT